MSNGYNATLAGGQEIYIPSWPANVQFENLVQATKQLGQDHVINISALNVPAAMLAVMGSEDSKAVTSLVLHFVQQCRIDGEKVSQANFDTLGLPILIELFTHVMHSQYHAFFESGLAKAASPQS